MIDRLSLSKHHGAGNDFLVLVDPTNRWSLTPQLARALCNRRTGIGADGVMRASPSADALVPCMELRNADGSSAEMSGNGIRCFAQAVLEKRLVSSRQFSIVTGAGQRHVSVELNPDINDVMVQVDMGQPRFLGKVTLDLPHGRPSQEACRVSVGNPHLVMVLETLQELDSLDIAGLGSALEAQHGANVEWVVPVNSEELVLRVWERGAGETQACGTGSVASVVAGAHLGICGPRAKVRNPGGTLEVDVSGEEAQLVGQAILVAQVEIEPGWLDREVK